VGPPDWKGSICRRPPSAASVDPQSQPTRFNEGLPGRFLLNGRIYGLLIRLREWGRRGGDGSATPTLPTALGFAGAADVIQRGADGVVANSNRAAGGLSIPRAAPVRRLGTHTATGRHATT
jgi:hypothetical protein